MDSRQLKKTRRSARHVEPEVVICGKDGAEVALGVSEASRCPWFAARVNASGRIQAPFLELEVLNLVASYCRLAQENDHRSDCSGGGAPPPRTLAEPSPSSSYVVPSWFSPFKSVKVGGS